MNKNTIIAFIGLALVVGLLLFFFDSSGEEAKHTRMKSYYSDWEQQYETKNPNPRNISFFLELLKAHTQDSVYVARDWDDFDSLNTKEKTTYLYIGENMGMDDDDYDEIMTYVDSGATAFFAFDYVTSNIYERHFEPNAYYWDYSKNLYAWIGDTSLKYSYVYQSDSLYADWYMFNESAIRDTDYVSYAFAMNKPIAFYQNQHKGKLHFHSVPRLFENYQVISSNGYAHASFILKRIPKHQPVVVLLCAENKPYQINYNNDEDGEGNKKQDSSLIQYILKNPALRLAFVLSIVLILLYLFFRAKRRESIIPGSPQKQNMGLAFVETLSSIYISRNSPIGVLKVMRKNFYSAMARHFYVDLVRKESREQQIERLIERSNYDKTELLKIINGLQSRNNDVNYQHLATVYNDIRKFYMETGILHESKQFVAVDHEVRIERSLSIGGLSLIVGLTLLFRGLYLLTLGGGIGMLLIIPASLVIFFASRILRKPLMEIQRDKLIVYGLIFGKKEINLNQVIQTETLGSVVKFNCEDGTNFEIRTLLITKKSRTILANFVEYLKNHKS